MRCLSSLVSYACGRLTVPTILAYTPSGELVHAQVREQVKPAEVVVVTRREPTREEILQKFRDAIGLSGGEEFESDGQLEDSLSEEELREFRQGRGPAWEELQRRRRERREQEQRLGMR